MSSSFILLMTGCPAPTPAERVRQLGATINDRGNGILDLDFTGSKLTDSDVMYIHGFCANSNRRWKSIHTLNLSGTKISDQALEKMAMQKPFSPPTGLSVLILDDTNVSDRAIEKLKQVTPNCEIRKNSK